MVFNTKILSVPLSSFLFSPPSMTKSQLHSTQHLGSSPGRPVSLYLEHMATLPFLQPEFHLQLSLLILFLVFLLFFFFLHLNTIYQFLSPLQFRIDFSVLISFTFLIRSTCVQEYIHNLLLCAE